MVGEDDKVELNGRLLQLENKKIYIVLNKPKGYITSLKDDRERPVVMDLIGDIQERIPVFHKPLRLFLELNF